MIEITESELPYYERPDPIEGFEWRLMKPKQGYKYLCDNNKLVTALSDITDCYFWCKVPVKVAGWKEYKVVAEDGVYYLLNDNGLKWMALITAFGRVGFDGWQTNDDVSNERWNFCLPSRDVIPCKARFWSVS